jgi:hypothetical protein
MALPIKANDTQEGCNPIASNCVIWQGPDIPCIKLCKGDTISDVSAKLAERLCTILDYLDVSAYDLTCFNPICPSPRDFQELIQLLIDRICAINNIVNPTNGGGGGSGTVGCPDCIVPVATCLQRPDALGNITATLQLRDYVILIGNEICTITTSLAAIDSRVTSLEAAVTDIQNNCCAGGGGSGGDLVMPASVCVGTGANTPVIDYLVALDAAFCTLQTSSGTQNDTNTALSYKCINGTDTLPSGTGTWNSVPGWIDSPTNLAQAVQDLWLVACQQNDAIISLNTTVEELQTQLALCCGIAATCQTARYIAAAWYEPATGAGLSPGYFVIGFDPVLSSIPAGYSICQDTPATVTVFPSNQSGPISPPLLIDPGNDFDEIHYPGPFRTPGLGNTGPYAGVPGALFATITIDMCITNGTDTCTTTAIISNVRLEGSIQDVLKASLTAGGTPENPTVRATLYPDGYPVIYTGGTQWVMNLRLGNNNGPVVASTTVNTASQGSKIEFTFTDLLPGQSYGMTVNIIQGAFSELNIQALNNAVTPAAPAPAP